MTKRGKGKPMQVQTSEGRFRVLNPDRIRVPDLEERKGELVYNESRVTVTRNLRDDLLGQMHDRHQIGEAQYAAAREYQATREAEGIGRGRSSSDLREHVDGGQIASDGLTDTRLKAAKKIAGYRVRLGEEGYRLIEAVLIEKTTLRECCQRFHGQASRANVIYVGRRFRECLSTLAKIMGYG